jgi:hypothetical protein
MDQQYPRLSVTIIQPEAFVVTVWLHASADTPRQLLLKNAAAGSLEEAHTLIRSLAEKHGIPLERVDIDTRF